MCLLIRKRFTGPIYEQVDSAYHFILHHINIGAEINGVYRNDTSASFVVK